MLKGGQQREAGFAKASKVGQLQVAIAGQALARTARPTANGDYGGVRGWSLQSGSRGSPKPRRALSTPVLRLSAEGAVLRALRGRRLALRLAVRVAGAPPPRRPARCRGQGRCRHRVKTVPLSLNPPGARGSDFERC